MLWLCSSLEFVYCAEFTLFCSNYHSFCLEYLNACSFITKIQQSTKMVKFMLADKLNAQFYNMQIRIFMHSSSYHTMINKTKKVTWLSSWLWSSIKSVLCFVLFLHIWKMYVGMNQNLTMKQKGSLNGKKQCNKAFQPWKKNAYGSLYQNPRLWNWIGRVVSLIDRLKACLVAHRFSHKYGQDYDKKFNLIAKMVTVQTIISLAASKG